MAYDGDGEDLCKPHYRDEPVARLCAFWGELFSGIFQVEKCDLKSVTLSYNP